MEKTQTRKNSKSSKKVDQNIDSIKEQELTSEILQIKMINQKKESRKSENKEIQQRNRVLNEDYATNPLDFQNYQGLDSALGFSVDSSKLTPVREMTQYFYNNLNIITPPTLKESHQSVVSFLKEEETEENDQLDLNLSSKVTVTENKQEDEEIYFLKNKEEEESKLTKEKKIGSVIFEKKKGESKEKKK